MQDTPPEIVNKQNEVFMSKSEGERLAIGLGMIDFGRALAESKIMEENPGIGPAELKAEVFKLFYKNDFTADKLEEIASWLRGT